MKTVCVYHSIDLDGWMSAAIVKHWCKQANDAGEYNCMPEDITFLGYNYGQPIPDLSEYGRVIMCDISFPKEHMEVLFTFLQDNFIWCDHHISAIKDSETMFHHKAKGIRDTKFSACELTWKYFMSNPIDKFGEVEDQNPMPEIVRLLGRYDCFGHKDTDEEQKVLEFQYGARSIISNYEDAYNYLIDSLNPTFGIVEDVLYNGGLIYSYLCTDAKQIYKNGFEVILSEYRDETCSEERLHKFICINKERFNPINFGIDYHKDGYDGVACFHYANGKWNFSLYNDNGEVDCSAIAKQYGGGGHKGAAGFIIDDINKIIGNGNI